MISIRNVTIADLNEIVRIEKQCFTNAEAATKEVFKQRIHVIPDTFLVAIQKGEIVGFINGPVILSSFITDDLFQHVQKNPTIGGHQSILGLAVSPLFQKQGIASQLLLHLEEIATRKKRKTMTLTCKEALIPFYERNKYILQGKSTSLHGGEVWYNMVKEISSSREC